jgi:hypothetical protein
VIRPLNAALLVCSFAFLACTQLPKPPADGEVRTSGSALLEARSPMEVVVAPIQGGAMVPGEDLRHGFQQALIARRYSPLALRQVDKKIVDASYKPGSLAEQAVFETKIARFDTSLFDTNGAITVSMTMRMVDSADGTVLWTGSVERRFDCSSHKDQYATSAARLRAACEYITGEVLEALPARNPVPGYANG